MIVLYTHVFISTFRDSDHGWYVEVQACELRSTCLVGSNNMDLV